MFRFIITTLCLVMVVHTLATGNSRARAGDKPKYIGEKFLYPNRDKPHGGLTAPNIEQTRLTTKDDFDKVVQYYEKLIRDGDGNNLAVAPGESLMSGTSKFVTDASNGRVVQLRVFVHVAKTYVATIVVSRVKDEKKTDIAIIVKGFDK